MMIDLGSTVVDAMANATVSLVRRASGSYDAAGKWVPGAATTTDNIKAVVQPASGRVLRDMPEGKREEARFVIWVNGTLALDDVIVYRSERYRVVYLWDRESDGGYAKAAIGLER